MLRSAARFRLMIVYSGLDLDYFRSTLSLAGSQVSDADSLPFGLDFAQECLAEEEDSAQDT